MQAITTDVHDVFGQEFKDLGVDLEMIGTSESGRALFAYRMGPPDGPLVSIVAGAHPDEPAGPLAAMELARRYYTSPILQAVQFAVVPHLDVDGTHEQGTWLAKYDELIDPLLFLEHRLRRLPGADREFAWPGAPWTGCVLKENCVADEFLKQSGPAIAHLSLHGMAIAEGAWFLLDHELMRDAQLWQDLRRATFDTNLNVHESFRHGEKGFRRAGHGFCTIPNAAAMRRWALTENPRFKNSFGYSSMEAACQRAYAVGTRPPLCAVSEFPLLAVQNSGDGNWRSDFAQIPFADDPTNAWQAFSNRYNVQRVPLSNQVHGMLAMLESVVAAALRRN